MFSLKKVLAGALGAGVAIVIVALPASSAVASPNAWSGCHSPSLSIPQACLSVTGSGLYIGTLKGWDNNPSAVINWQNLHIELTGPNGLIKNCPEFNLPIRGQSPACSWSPNHTEKAGMYGQTTWERQGTNYIKLTGISVNVHS